MGNGSTSNVSQYTLISSYGSVKVDLYLTKYLDFYNEFEDFPHKKVDEALWSYGKFLTQDYTML